MSDYNGVAKHKWGDGDDCLRVRVFGEDAISRNNLDEAYDAVERAVSEVYYDDYRAANVDYAEVAEYVTSEDVPCNGSTREERRRNMRDHIENWLDDHGFDDQGCYLWLVDCGVAYGWDGAWSGRSIALVSTDWYSYPTSYLRAMSIHEAFHTYINHGCDDVSARTDGNEHELGTVTLDDEVTPMAASYEDSEKYHEDGDCSGQNPDNDSYTVDLSDCAVGAVSDSLEHKNSWFHDV